jgi:hypothetical protein
MRKRSVVVAVGSVLTAVLIFGGSASAATVAGNNCAANSASPIYTLVSLAGAAGNPFPNSIPSAGVITSWSIDDELTSLPPSFDPQQQLKIFRPTGVAKQLQAVGESALAPVNLGPNTFQTRIPVQAGDLIGSTGTGSISGETIQIVLYCETMNEGDLVGAVVGNPSIGSTSVIALEAAGVAVPVTVTVEPDADGDGFGDETQDKCPTNASTQSPCPAPVPPPAPIALSASAAAKKGLVTVTLTSSAQASVTVGGTVKLGKGKSATLSGGTQIVAPGTLAKFTVLFPAKLKARLKQLPPKQKLTLSLSASAPGATGTALTVKVKGQKKAKPQHHPKG